MFENISFKSVQKLLTNLTTVVFINQVLPEDDEIRTYEAADMDIPSTVYYPLLFVASSFFGLLFGFALLFVAVFLLNIPELLSSSVSISQFNIPNVQIWSVIWPLIEPVWWFIEALLEGVAVGLFVIIPAFIIGSLVWSVGRYYPQYKANERGRVVDSQEYMFGMAIGYAVAQGDTSAFDVMAEIAKAKSLIPNLAVDARHFVSLVARENRSVQESTTRTALVTPSREFRNTLDRMGTLIESGGDLSGFFRSQIDRAAKQSDRQLENMKSLYSLLGQVSNILLISPSLVLMISLGGIIPISIVMTFVYGGSVGIIVLMVALFYILAKRTVPPHHPLETTQKGVKVNNSGVLTREMRRFVFGETYKEDAGLWYLRKNLEAKSLKKWLIANPYRVLIFTLPVASLYLGVLFAVGIYPVNIGKIQTLFIDAPVMTTLLLVVIPFHFIIGIPMASLNYIKNKRNSAIIERAASFFREVRSINDAGQPIEQAFEQAAENTSGPLGEEVELMVQHARFHDDFESALIAMANRVKESRITFATFLILKARGASSNIGDVLATISQTITQTRDQEKDQKSATSEVAGTIMASMFITILMLAAVTFMVVPQMADVSATSGGGGQSVGGMSFSIPPMPLVFAMSVHLSVIMATGSSLLFGIVRNSDALSGLKLSIIFVILSLGLFMAAPPI